MKRTIRYTKRITIPLTRECSNNCLYCGFKKKNSKLVSLSQVKAILGLAKDQECTEIRLMSGTNLHLKEGFKEQLLEHNVSTLAQYAYVIANMVLNYGFIPVLEIGLLNISELKILRNVAANIYLLLECKDEKNGFTSYKDRKYYLQMLRDGGKLKIPFTTGIVVGLGETQEERFNIVSRVTKIYEQYGHIQEFVIQGYILNEHTRLPLQNFLTIKELRELYLFIREKMPDVAIQVQPNTIEFWPDLIKLGADSIGGISEEIDYVVPRYNEEEMENLNLNLKKLGCKLQKELPLTIKFYQLGLYSSVIANVLSFWLEDKRYKFYHK